MNLRATSLFSQEFSNTKDNLNAKSRSSWMVKAPNLSYFVTQLFKANSESKTTQKYMNVVPRSTKNTNDDTEN